MFIIVMMMMMISMTIVMFTSMIIAIIMIKVMIQRKGITNSKRAMEIIKAVMIAIKQ